MCEYVTEDNIHLFTTCPKIARCFEYIKSIFIVNNVFMLTLTGQGIEVDCIHAFIFYVKSFYRSPLIGIGHSHCLKIFLQVDTLALGPET